MTHTHVPLRMRRRARGAGYAQEEGRGTRGMAARGGDVYRAFMVIQPNSYGLLIHGYTAQSMWMYIAHTFCVDPNTYILMYLLATV